MLRPALKRGLLRDGAGVRKRNHHNNIAFFGALPQHFFESSKKDFVIS